jgi:hypothetical protein
VHRLLGEEQQDRRADVTARDAAPAAAATMRRTVVRPGPTRVVGVVVTRAGMPALVSVQGVHHRDS